MSWGLWSHQEAQGSSWSTRTALLNKNRFTAFTRNQDLAGTVTCLKRQRNLGSFCRARHRPQLRLYSWGGPDTHVALFLETELVLLGLILCLNARSSEATSTSGYRPYRAPDAFIHS